MAKQNKKTLKGYFETGDVPNQTQYQHLIDSQLNLAETGTQILVGTLSSSFLEVENHITASGNISSSGTVTAEHILSSDDIVAQGDISSSGIVTMAQSVTVGRHYFDAFGGSNAFIMKTGDNLLIDNAGLIVNSHITASGNISASGDITANDIFVSGLLSRKGDPNTGLQFSSDTVNIESNDVIIGKFSSTRVELNSPVTASGNISASGDISANNATIAGQIDMTSTTNAVLNMYQDASLNTSLQSRGNINSFIEAGNSTANLGVGTSTPAEKLTVHGNISGSGNLKVDGSQVDFTNLPTSDPSVAGRLYRDGTDLKISLG